MIRYLYGIIQFLSWGVGIYLAYRAWSWWSIAWLLGSLAVGLILCLLIGIIANGGKMQEA